MRIYFSFKINRDAHKAQDTFFFKNHIITFCARSMFKSINIYNTNSNLIFIWMGLLIFKLLTCKPCLAFDLKSGEPVNPASAVPSKAPGLGNLLLYPGIKWPVHGVLRCLKSPLKTRRKNACWGLQTKNRVWCPE